MDGANLSDPKDYDKLKDKFEKAISPDVSKAEKLSNFQYNCFIIGMVFFTIWHILEMIKTTIST